MDLEYLKEFAYLGETLSFSRTAKHFYVNRSAISRHISSLEEEVGVQLLDRGSHSVSLTDAGAVFLSEVKAILASWNSALERTKRADSDKRVIVRIGYLRNAARPVLVRFVRHMANAHPNIQLSLICMEFNSLQDALAEHAVDIALAVNVSPELSRHYRNTPIYTDRFSAVCSKNHVLAKKTEGVTIQDLEGMKVLLPSSVVFAGVAEYLEGIMDEKDILAAQLPYRDIDMLYLKVQTEDYVALSSNMNNAMFEDGLAILPILDVDAEFCVSAFYHDDFLGPAFEACEESFEWCREDLKSYSANISMKHFE